MRSDTASSQVQLEPCDRFSDLPDSSGLLLRTWHPHHWHPGHTPTPRVPGPSALHFLGTFFLSTAALRVLYVQESHPCVDSSQRHVLGREAQHRWARDPPTPSCGPVARPRPVRVGSVGGSTGWHTPDHRSWGERPQVSTGRPLGVSGSSGFWGHGRTHVASRRAFPGGPGDPPGSPAPRPPARPAGPWTRTPPTAQRSRGDVSREAPGQRAREPPAHPRNAGDAEASGCAGRSPGSRPEGWTLASARGGGERRAGRTLGELAPLRGCIVRGGVLGASRGPDRSCLWRGGPPTPRAMELLNRNRLAIVRRRCARREPAAAPRAGALTPSVPFVRTQEDRTPEKETAATGETKRPGGDDARPERTGERTAAGAGDGADVKPERRVRATATATATALRPGPTAGDGECSRRRRHRRPRGARPGRGRTSQRRAPSAGPGREGRARRGRGAGGSRVPTLARWLARPGEAGPRGGDGPGDGSPPWLLPISLAVATDSQVEAELAAEGLELGGRAAASEPGALQASPGGRVHPDPCKAGANTGTPGPPETVPLGDMCCVSTIKTRVCCKTSPVFLRVLVSVVSLSSPAPLGSSSSSRSRSLSHVSSGVRRFEFPRWPGVRILLLTREALQTRLPFVSPYASGHPARPRVRARSAAPGLGEQSPRGKQAGEGARGGGETGPGGRGSGRPAAGPPREPRAPPRCPPRARHGKGPVRAAIGRAAGGRAGIGQRKGAGPPPGMYYGAAGTSVRAGDEEPARRGPCELDPPTRSAWAARARGGRRRGRERADATPRARARTQASRAGVTWPRAAAAAARCTHTERSPQVPGARAKRCTGAEWSSGSARSPRKQSPGTSSHREPSSLSSSSRSRHRQQQPRERRQLPRPGSAETRRAPSDPAAAAALRSPCTAARATREAPREPARPAGAAAICWRFLQ
ncbi:collagen, type I, alpha 1a-like [Cynocephalus volans]|uniref:collagen, type I, alpha 1a-like n=1 Tax=Cynocephalus volans TaxID=110931 RepID=UPI002FC61FB0